ncbi:MAG: RluA family pseudouridine synthase [Holosporaceae bacterium]|nr:RluA family pseudouridine synthase [Holosporaceae bacterium]
MEHIVTPEENGTRADRILRNLCKNLSYVFLQKIFRTHRVKVNGKKVSASDRLCTGDVLTIYIAVAADPKESAAPNLESGHNKKLLKQFESMIIFENDDLVAINKLPGLAVQSGTKVNFCVETFLKIYQAQRHCECRLVHRIDKDTSGILLIAKNQIMARKLAELFRENKIKKIYLAVVDCANRSFSEAEEGKIDNFFPNDRGVDLHALTHYRCLKSAEQYALLELKPSTGRKHQLRIHCATVLNAPILGDKKYNDDPQQRELFLHAFKISSRELKLEITAPIPQYFGINHPISMILQKLPS